ncbi:MAG: NAD(P)/FAD-dependent oxidoreductase [Tannerella sp.]|jgi:all-trans-retinol 13,14-reductase|nr:NAD(P)/FAD-dependent oxidoreductase [Tannerella sp.]
MDSRQTVIIIGGGIGGLFCGALLSGEGRRVKVFERHTRIGGGLHQFVRQGVTFETGMHVMGAFHPGGVLNRLCACLGILDRLNVMPMDEDGFDLFHVRSDGRRYFMPRGRERFTANLCAHFPEESGNIRRYVDAMYGICREVRLYNMEKPDVSFREFSDDFMRSVGDFIDSFTRNERLRHVMAYCNPLYAGDRYTTPVYIHALISKFYIEGSCRFVGGSQQLADALVDVIREAGGEVHAGNGVRHVEIENRSAAYVVTEDGATHRADCYISSIHPSSFFKLVDTSRIQRSYWQRIDAIPNTYSAFTLYIIFKPGTFPFFNYTYYCQDDYEDTWRHHLYTDATWPRGMMLITPPVTGHDVYAEKMIVNCVMNFDTVRQWEHTLSGRRGAAYEAFKRRCEETVVRRLEEIFPGIRACIASVYSASPLTIRDYANQKEGAMYGVRKDCRNMALSHVAVRTKLKNLYFTGQNVNLHGILGVPLTAINTCAELVGMEHLLDRINGTGGKETAQ